MTWSNRDWRTFSYISVTIQHLLARNAVACTQLSELEWRVDCTGAIDDELVLPNGVTLDVSTFELTIVSIKEKEQSGGTPMATKESFIHVLADSDALLALKGNNVPFEFQGRSWIMVYLPSMVYRTEFPRGCTFPQGEAVLPDGTIVRQWGTALTTKSFEQLIAESAQEHQAFVARGGHNDVLWSKDSSAPIQDVGVQKEEQQESSSSQFAERSVWDL